MNSQGKVDRTTARLGFGQAFLRWATIPIVASALVVGSAAASPEPPGVTEQVAGVHSFLVGDVRVTALSDGTLPIDLPQVLRGIAPKRIEALLAQNFQRNPVETSINAFLIELGDRRVLVDAGSGELFGPGVGGRLPRALAAIGMHPDQITDILITHVHSDHSGGLAVGGRMIFPNATVHVGLPDIDFFLDSDISGRTADDNRLSEEAARTLGLYVAADRVKPFDRSGEILPGIVAELRPGHTPGATFYTLTSRDQRIVFIGDTLHAAAVQLPEPAVTIIFDQNQTRAREVRQQAFARFAAEGTLLAAPHISFPGVGRIRQEGKGYRWIPIEYGDRNAGAKGP